MKEPTPNAYCTTPLMEGDLKCEISSAAAKTSITVWSCWGFSTGSRQSAALVPSSSSALRQDSVRNHLLVYCLGSWCVVRNAKVDTTRSYGEAGSLRPNDLVQSLPVQSSTRRNRNEWSRTTEGVLDAVNSCSIGRISPPYTQRVFSRHNNKVNIIVYCHALNICFSGTTRPQWLLFLHTSRK